MQSPVLSCMQKTVGNGVNVIFSYSCKAVHLLAERKSGNEGVAVVTVGMGNIEKQVDSRVRSRSLWNWGVSMQLSVSASSKTWPYDHFNKKQLLAILVPRE